MNCKLTLLLIGKSILDLVSENGGKAHSSENRYSNPTRRTLTHVQSFVAWLSDTFHTATHQNIYNGVGEHHQNRHNLTPVHPSRSKEKWFLFFQPTSAFDCEYRNNTLELEKKIPTIIKGLWFHEHTMQKSDKWKAFYRNEEVNKTRFHPLRSKENDTIPISLKRALVLHTIIAAILPKRQFKIQPFSPK